MTSATRLTLASVGALAAGALNGLLGAGGGIILIFALAPALGGITTKHGELYSRRDVLATSLSVMIPISAVSALRYAAAGSLDLSLASRVTLPAILGGLLGGFLLCRLKEGFIAKIFALLVIYSGISMIMR